MAFSTDSLFRGTDSPIYLILGLLMGAMGVFDLVNGYDDGTIGSVATLAGAVSMLSFYIGAKASMRWLSWVAVAAFVVFAVAAVGDLVGLFTGA